MNCKFYPEITNCVNCDYFDIVETDTDFKTVCLKYEEESDGRTKDQTFAEWLLDYTSTHKDAVVSIEQGPYGDIKIQIRDYSKRSTGIAAQHYITYDIYRASKLSFDKILIVAAEELCKEIENYGS